MVIIIMIIVQILIFLGCTAFHPFFHAWRLEVLVRKCFLHYLILSFMFIFITSNMASQL